MNRMIRMIEVTKAGVQNLIEKTKAGVQQFQVKVTCFVQCESGEGAVTWVIASLIAVVMFALIFTTIKDPIVKFITEDIFGKIRDIK